MKRLLLFLPVMIALTDISWGNDEPEPQGTLHRTGAPGLQSYSPGIWIDWKEKAVELDARVVLQRGLLELFACSPNTREHESILVVSGRPRDIHHALGLIGLSSGSPVRYDEKAERWLAPTGQQLHLDMRYQYKGSTRVESAVAWVKSPKTGKPPDRIDWVFAGSTTLPEGRYGGDVDGTVVAVVDFESAVVAVGGVHTADNASLWLEANSDAIPPVGTPCRLVISALDQPTKLHLGKDGQLRLGQSIMPPADVARRFRNRQERGWHVLVLVTSDPGIQMDKRQEAAAALVRAGIPRQAITVVDSPAESPGRDGDSRHRPEQPPIGSSRVE